LEIANTNGVEDSTRDKEERPAVIFETKNTFVIMGMKRFAKCCKVPSGLRNKGFGLRIKSIKSGLL